VEVYETVRILGFLPRGIGSPAQGAIWFKHNMLDSFDWHGAGDKEVKSVSTLCFRAM
jgi:hypothetical protein